MMSFAAYHNMYRPTTTTFLVHGEAALLQILYSTQTSPEEIGYDPSKLTWKQFTIDILDGMKEVS
jgi:hypothetical protein